MTGYLVQRLVSVLAVVAAIAVITFVLMHAVPGGPCQQPQRLLGDACERLKAHYGLDRPWWQQLGAYTAHLAQGDLGVSSAHGDRPVTDVLANGIRVSATLGVLALALSVTVGVGLGVAGALRQRSAMDYLGVGFATLAASVPNFMVGLLLLALFVGRLHWLPTGGWGSPQQALMPALALSALPAAYLARVTRAAMLDVLGQDFVRTARAKGLPERAVLLRHMLRNALIPVLTVLGPMAAALVTGSFVVEKVFGIPGVGFAFVESVAERDYGMIMGATLFYTCVVVFANLVVDVGYAFVDPRIRRSPYA